MDRRSFMKGGLAASAFGVTGAAVLKEQEVEPGSRDIRTVFKLIEHNPITHLRVGSDQWEPTAEEIDSLVQAFVAAEKDATSQVIGTRHDVKIEPITTGGLMLVKVPFKDLKKGDRFIMYEEDGTLVVDETEGYDKVVVWECQEDAYANTDKLGSSSVYCEPVPYTYTFPEMCPA